MDRRPARPLRPVGRRADRDADRDQPLDRSPRRTPAGRTPTCASAPAPVDGWELTAARLDRGWSTDDQLIPVGEEPVDGTAYDFRISRPVRDTVIDHAFGDLDRDE